MKVVIGMDQYLAPSLRFPGDPGYTASDESAMDVPADVAARWRDTRDAWWSMVREVERFAAERSVTQ